MAVKKVSDTKMLIGPVRFSYANVWKPKAVSDDDDAKLKYSVCLLFSKKDKLLLAKVQKKIQTAIAAGKDTFKGKKPTKMPLRDGDEKDGDSAYEGHWFLNANSDNPPGILGPDKEPIINKDEFYSGCYGYASINFYAFNQRGNVGIGVGLNNLLKLKEGERLSGRDSAESDFEELEIEDDVDTDPVEDDIDDLL